MPTQCSINSLCVMCVCAHWRGMVGYMAWLCVMIIIHSPIRCPTVSQFMSQGFTPIHALLLLSVYSCPNKNRVSKSLSKCHTSRKKLASTRQGAYI